jgi:hypothetical protein
MIAKIIAARNRGPAEIVIASSVMANLIPSCHYSRTIRYSVANETPIGDTRNTFCAN